MSKFIHSFLVGPFFGWRESAQKSKRLRHAGAQCLQRMKNSRVNAVFCCWQEAIKEKLRLMHAGKKCLLRIQNRALYVTFSAWDGWL